MLPDIIPLKRQISIMMQREFRARVSLYMGVINEVPRTFIKEGNKIIILRPDGTEDETVMRAFTGHASLDMQEMVSLSFQERAARLDGAARDMAQQLSENAFSEIGTAAESVGNVIDGQGQPLTPATLLEMYRKIQLDFDPDTGRHQDVTVVMGDALRSDAAKAMQELLTDPALQQKFHQLIEEKRRECRDREARRRLVG